MSIINNKKDILQVEPLEEEFKKVFKTLKSKETISPHKLKEISDDQLLLYTPLKLNSDIDWKASEDCIKNLGLKQPSEWNIYSIEKHPGLFIIRNPFTFVGILQWIKRCIQHYSELPNKTNLYNLDICSSWWNEVKDSLARNDDHSLAKKLRWATIGYHHDWNTKVYDFNESSPMPDAITDLCRLFLLAVDLPEGENYKAEAVIVNYYPPGSTLSPHTDHSEPNHEAPLVSLSFGRSAIFLIGGRNKSVAPSPVFLHQGDIVIMAGESRLSYHAVPRILSQSDAIYFDKCRQLEHFRTLLSQLIDVLEAKSETMKEEFVIDLNRLSEVIHKEDLFDASVQIDYFVSPLRNLTTTSEEQNFSDAKSLKAFWSYVGSTRINMNIRQVHFGDHFNKFIEI